MNTESRKKEAFANTVRQLTIATVSLTVLVALAVTLFLRSYDSYNDSVLYAERLNQMREVTEQLFSGLEDVVQVQWDTAKYQRNYLAYCAPGTVDEMIQIMQQQAELNSMTNDNEIIAIDRQGRYYTQNGKQGLMVDMSPLAGRPEQVSYVFNEMTTTLTQMLFLYRIDSPLSCRTVTRRPRSSTTALR